MKTILGSVLGYLIANTSILFFKLHDSISNTEFGELILYYVFICLFGVIIGGFIGNYFEKKI